MDPFDLLALPATFDLDPAALQRAYLRGSAAIHPDLAAGDPDAARRAAALNHAKTILENPERRASALLARLGGPPKEQDRSLPPGFLAEILEIREQIEGAGGDPSQRARWEDWASQRREEYAVRISRMFRDLSADAAGLRAIRTELNAWRYIERLVEQLDPNYDPARADFQG